MSRMSCTDGLLGGLFVSAFVCRDVSVWVRLYSASVNVPDLWGKA